MSVFIEPTVVELFGGPFDGLRVEPWTGGLYYVVLDLSTRERHRYAWDMVSNGFVWTIRTAHYVGVE